MCAAAACHLQPGFSRVLKVSAIRQGLWEKGLWEKGCSDRTEELTRANDNGDTQPRTILPAI